MTPLSYIDTVLLMLGLWVIGWCLRGGNKIDPEVRRYLKAKGTYYIIGTIIGGVIAFFINAWILFAVQKALL